MRIFQELMKQQGGEESQILGGIQLHKKMLLSKYDIHSPDFHNQVLFSDQNTFSAEIFMGFLLEMH